MASGLLVVLRGVHLSASCGRSYSCSFLFLSSSFFVYPICMQLQLSFALYLALVSRIAIGKQARQPLNKHLITSELTCLVHIGTSLR